MKHTTFSMFCFKKGIYTQHIVEGSMSEENKNVASETVSEQPTPEAQTDSTNVSDLIAESKKYRKRSQDAEARLAKLESQLAKAEKAKLKEKEDFKTLYEQNEAKIESLAASADKWSKYQEAKTAALLEGVPEDEREALSKLDFETLEYVTNKISDIKPNMSEVAGQARASEIKKPYTDMTDAERRQNWTNIVKQSKLR